MALIKAASKATNTKGGFSWPRASSIKQKFAFPSTIIFYIVKNLSTPEFYLHLAKCCKYFFEANPIIIPKCIYNRGTKMCSKQTYFHKHKNKRCCVNVNINKIPSKIWVTDEIKLANYPFLHPSSSSLLSKLYLGNSCFLYITNAKMTFDEFKLWTNAFSLFIFESINVIDADGNIVMLEKIIESIPKITDFAYDFDIECPAATASTMKNLLKLKSLDSCRLLHLQNIPEIFTIEDLKILIMEKMIRTVRLKFLRNISQEYKNQLDRLIDTIIESKRLDCIIQYPGQDKDKREIMNSNYTY